MWQGSSWRERGMAEAGWGQRRMGTLPISVQPCTGVWLSSSFHNVGHSSCT